MKIIKRKSQLLVGLFFLLFLGCFEFSNLLENAALLWQHSGMVAVIDLDSPTLGITKDDVSVSDGHRKPSATIFTEDVYHLSCLPSEYLLNLEGVGCPVIEPV